MIELLRARFLDQKNLHPDLNWSEVESRLREAPDAMEVKALALSLLKGMDSLPDRKDLPFSRVHTRQGGSAEQD